MALTQENTLQVALTGDGVSTTFIFSPSMLYVLDLLDANAPGNIATPASSVTVQSVPGAWVMPTASVDLYGNVTLTFGTAPTAITGYVQLQLNYTGVLAGTTSSWTSATALNTTWTLPLSGLSMVQVAFTVTGSLTGGTVLFQASVDGGTWFGIQGTTPSAFTTLTGWQTGVGTQAVQFNVAGFSYFRLLLTPALTGTGTLGFVINGTQRGLETFLTVGQSAAANLNCTATLAAGVNAIGTVIDTPTATSSIALAATVINASGAKTLIKGSAGNLFGMFFQNNTAVASFIQFFDAATVGAVTLGTTAPVWAAPIPASGILLIPVGHFALKNFASGIVFAATSTLQGATVESMSGTIESL